MSDEELRNDLLRIWKKDRMYSISEIIHVLKGEKKKKKKHRNTIRNWREYGIKLKNKTIRLQMIKTGGCWQAKGEWIINFFIGISRS